METPLNNEISIESDIFGTRLLIFIEESPQSNKYRQVFLNEEEFKKVSFSIGDVVSEDDGIETVIYKQSEEIYDLPDLREIN